MKLASILAISSMWAADWLVTGIERFMGLGTNLESLLRRINYNQYKGRCRKWK